MLARIQLKMEPMSLKGVRIVDAGDPSSASSRQIAFNTSFITWILLIVNISIVVNYRVYIKYCVFFQEFSKVCLLSLTGTRLLLVVQKITSQ